MAHNPRHTRRRPGETTDMPQTIACSAELMVDLPRSAALALFTAEGERAWAPDWQPTFPAPQRREGSGTVFLTEHGPQTTTWVMVDHNEHGLRYARVTDGATAGTVAVTVLASEATHTRLRVSYDLSALTLDGARWLETFAEGFDRYIAHWQTAIAAALPHQQPQRPPNQ